MDTTESQIAALEELRCAALVAGNIDALASLLAPELTHVHANGDIDDHNTYLRNVRDKLRFRAVRRKSLAVRFHGEVAIAVGRLEQVVEIVASGQQVPMSLVTTQAWVRSESEWLLSTFHATRCEEARA